jgi:serine phosphatase RsbU (regulator of sigma subunit)/CheY-like chemotaxis protein
LGKKRIESYTGAGAPSLKNKLNGYFLIIMEKPVILCVDDEKAILEAMRRQLKSYMGERCVIETAQDGQEALEIIEELKAQNKKLAVIISDQMMPGITGDELLIRAHQMEPESIKILMTGLSGTEVLARLVNQARLFRFLTKPWDKVDFQLTVESALKAYLQSAQIQGYTRMLEALLNASKKIAKEHTLEGVAQTLLELLTEQLGADRAKLIIFEEDIPIYQGSYDAQTQTKILEETRIWEVEEEKIAAASFYKFPRPEILASKETLMQHNWENQVYLEQKKPKSFYYYPLFEEDKLCCLIYLEKATRKDYFTQERLQFLELMSHEIALAIEKAKLIRTLEQKVAQRTAEVTEKNKELKEKNQAILESIQYARRLQLSLMQPEKDFEALFPDSFILYKPKDVVSGDFYWFAAVQKKILFAAVDCTGHGVPGAMLSILGLNLLQTLVVENKITDTSEILSRMHRNIGQRLRQNQLETSADSMDIALCCYDPQYRALDFSGANRPLYLIREGLAHEIKGDMQPVGGSLLKKSSEEGYAFTRHSLNLRHKDEIYLFSDGLADQFGGLLNKKLSKRRVLEWLENYAGLPKKKAKNLLQEDIRKWQGPNEQTDDILVIGINLD